MHRNLFLIRQRNFRLKNIVLISTLRTDVFGLYVDLEICPQDHIFSKKYKCNHRRKIWRISSARKSVKMMSDDYNLQSLTHSNPLLKILHSCDKPFVYALFQIGCWKQCCRRLIDKFQGSCIQSWENSILGSGRQCRAQSIVKPANKASNYRKLCGWREYSEV